MASNDGVLCQRSDFDSAVDENLVQQRHFFQKFISFDIGGILTHSKRQYVCIDEIYL